MSETNTWDKKVLSILLALLLATVLSACNGGGNTDSTEPNTNVGDTEITEAADIGLTAYDGWWHLDESYTEGLPLLEIFYLSGTNETFTAVSLYGNELYEGSATMDANGNIVLSADVIGDITLRPDDEGLYDENGVLAFVMGEEPKAPDMSDISGKWYLNGDTSDEYYELKADSYNKIAADGYELGAGSFSSCNIIYQDPIGEAIEISQIIFGKDMMTDSGFFSPGYELFAVSGFGDTKIYVQESAIGTEEAVAALAQFSMIYDNWEATDKSCVFSFYRNGAFKYLTRVDFDGYYTFEDDDSGNWVLEGGALTISWTDGTEDVCDFTGNSFSVPSLGATIFNGKANVGVLRKWYGNYIGELGEVFISDTISDNRVSVSIYLDDDIGSMYSCSGMDLTPDGSTAGDEYFALHLDGDTLTIEPLTPNYENYAGTYEKQ